MKEMGLVTESLCSNFTRGHRGVAEMAVDLGYFIFRIFCFVFSSFHPNVFFFMSPVCFFPPFFSL